MTRDTASTPRSMAGAAAGTEIGPLVLLEVAEGWTGEINAVAKDILEVAILTDRTAQDGGDEARRLRRATGRLARKLHGQLGVARDWHRAVSEKGALDGAHLRQALDDLGQAVDRASIMLLETDIVLATPYCAGTRSLGAQDASPANGRRRGRREPEPFTRAQAVAQTAAERRERPKGVPATTRDPEIVSRRARAA